MSPTPAEAVRIITDWLATPNGAPSYWLMVPDREVADAIANEISYRLNLETMVHEGRDTCSGNIAVVVDRPKINGEV